ncbi:MAG: DNA recombination protein RmuC [Alphaproteobacteria bacterium]|nr:DNA recombination protein RmuC [Alphaproteobacteria bacterium]
MLRYVSIGLVVIFGALALTFAVRNGALTEENKQMIQTSVVFLQKQVDELKVENSRLKNENGDLRHRNGEVTGLKEQVFLLSKDKEELTRKNDQLIAETKALSVSNADLKTQIEIDQKHIAEKLLEIERHKKDLNILAERQFKELSERIIVEQSKSFQDGQTAALNNLLDPLREKIDSFNQDINSFKQKSGEDQAALNERLNYLLKQNNQLSLDTKGLTKALVGDTKFQGDWGEMRLEKLLEASGLVKNVDYVVREQAYSNQGYGVNAEKLRQFDYVVKLPAGRKIIIDSKISLSQYTNYVNALTKRERAESLTKHVAVLRNHMNELAQKSEERLKTNPNEYIFMFVPVEHAYLEALRADSRLIEEAANKKVAITTPSSLVPILRTVSQLWQLEKQNQHVKDMALLSSNLLDKLTSFVNELSGVDQALKIAQGKYDDAVKSLTTGTGSAVSIAKRIKELGLKAEKIDEDAAKVSKPAVTQAPVANKVNAVNPVPQAVNDNYKSVRYQQVQTAVK